MSNENCARLCQTEIALVPSSPLTDLYNIITYIDQEKIDEDALRIINIPQSAKRRSILPVSKFGLTDLARSEEKYFKTEETTVKKNKTEEMSSQTDLMVSPHILIEEEKAIASMSSSCQTFISCSPSISMINIDQQSEPKKNLDHDEDNQKQLYKNAAEILTDIVHDVITIPQRIFKPTIIKTVYGSQTSCSRENFEWNTKASEGNESLPPQVKDNSDEGMLNLLVNNSCKGDVLYCRSDDNVSVDSTISEKSSMPSLDYTANTVEEDFSVYAENVENEAIGDIEGNQSNVRLTYIEENKK